MARNEEKAQSMLNRYLRTKNEGTSAESRRPYLAILCSDVSEAEKWLRQILSDIRKRVSEIQNPGLDEARIRELNDSINKLLRERRHWERRIVFLGGPDRSRRRGKGGDPDFQVSEDAVFEHNGYFYFGSARNLPGVQELIEHQELIKENAKKRKKEESNAVLYRRVDKAYYGLDEDDDGSLARLEKLAEEKSRSKLIKEWEEEDGTGVEKQWDSSYVDYVGKKPAMSSESNVQSILLERRKVEALEQLEVRLEYKG